MQGPERQRDRPARHRRARRSARARRRRSRRYGIIQAGQDFTAAEPTFTVSEYGWDYYFGQLGRRGARRTSSASIPACPASGPASSPPARPLTEAGGKFDGKVVYPDAAPQSEATPIIQKIQSDGVNWVASTSVAVAKLMAEARVQGLDMTKVLWTLHLAVPVAVVRVSQNAEAVEGLYVSQLLTPFDETDVEGVRPLPRGRHRRAGCLGQR